MQIVTGHDDAVADWAGAVLGVQFQKPYVALGVMDNAGRLCGASIFNDFYPGGNMEWTHVGQQTLCRGVIRELAQYVFIEMKATRLTAKTRRGNTLVRRLLPRAGFTYEATQKRYFGPEKADDALVFVMFREDAEKWLR